MRKIINEICIKLKSYFPEDEEQIDTNNFLKGLNPIENIEDQDYLNTLKWAIDKKDITNIALSGPYGAGKSSIIKTFEKEYDSYDYKFLNISLATFKEKCNKHENDSKETKLSENNNSEIKENVDNNDISQELIEKSILQQMFYKEDANSIPNSRFKRIANTKYLKTKTGLLFIWFISILELFSPYTLINHLFNYSSYIDISVTLMSIFFILGILYFIYMLIRKISAVKLQKLSLQAPEISLAENDSDISILNKHIDEIIYFFEMTNYNVVIIEDLDRFNKPEVFIKLRELNKLLNESKQIDQQINFIYAIRDNMFINNERTKFFDFFIPVIPVINFTNSFTKLKKMFEEADLLDSMDEGFLKDISRYIHDMRLLQNIFSEFIQYKQHLENNLEKHTTNESNQNNIITLDNNEIFAIAVYKNHYPADFASLHEQKGMIYNIFEDSQKTKKVSLLTIEQRDKITNLKKEIDKLKPEIGNNKFKLRKEYMDKIIEIYPKLVSFLIDRNRLSIYQVLENEEYFNRLKDLHQLHYSYYQQPQSNNNTTFTLFDKSFEEIENEVNSDFTYDQRFGFIESSVNKDIRKLERKIKRIDNEIDRIQKSKISALLQEFKVEEILDKELLEENKKLLVYLVRYGWINEFYRRYISYYYPGEESINDISFVLSIRNREPNPNYSLKLTQIDKVLADIHDNEFSTISILNFDLLKYLLYHADLYSHKIMKILDILEESKNFDFIEQFLSLIDNEAKITFLKSLISQWEDFLDDLFKTDIIESKKDEYISLFIMEQDLQEDNLELIQNYLSTKTILQSLINQFNDASILIEFINNNGILFTNIQDYEYSKNEVYQFIYDNSHYIINPHMVKVISEVKDIEEFNYKNYGTIIDSKKEKLINYIHRNINVYIKNVYIAIPENKHDLGSSLIALFNVEGISEDSIINIFDHTEAIFTKMDNIPKIIWKKTLESQRTFPNLSNIKSLSENEDEDEYIAKIYVLSFFNETKNQFSFDIDYFKDLSDKNREYFEEMLSNERFDLKSFNRIVNSINFKFKKFHHLNENNDDKLNILLDLNLLELTTDNYEQIREDRNSKIRVKLFENNSDQLIEKYDELCVLYEDMEMIFNSDKISNDIKFIILNEFSDEEILLTLLEDLTNENTVESIYKVLMKNINHSFWAPCLIFIMKSNLSIDKKVEMLMQYNNFTHELIDRCLEILGYPYTDLLHNANSSTKVIKEKNIDKLVSKLQRIQYLGSTTDLNKSSYKVYKFKHKREIINDNVTALS